jgi:cytosine/creatinine deaminase
MGLSDYGLTVGRNGDLVVLQATDPIEAIRLKARRLHVVRRGKVIAESARAVTRLDLPGRPKEVDAASYAPGGSG